MSAAARSERRDDELLRRARSGEESAFDELATGFRAELELHCYRILGSLQDAEDMLQETLLAAWRGLDGFEGGASFRSWLYRIATNRCLNALRDRGRRPARPPEQAGPTPPPPPPTRLRESVWIEPYPVVLLEGRLDRSQEPDARYEVREAIGLAFAVGLQTLPPRQRAVPVLRDVLAFRAAEVIRPSPGIAISQSTIEQTALPSTNCRRTSKRVIACPASRAIAR